MRRLLIAAGLLILPSIVWAQVPPGGGGGGGTSSNFGSGFPGTGTAVGFKNAGGNMDWGLVDASHYLEINCVVGCSGGPADNVSFVEGTTAFNPVGGEYVSGGAGNLTSGHAGAAQLTIDRMLYVNLGKVNGVATLTGTGAVGAGTQRIAVGTDTATIAGSAPGTAGTASANVVSVQGVASMTPLLANPGTAANWGLGATGSAVPANGVYLGSSQGGNLVGNVTCGSHAYAHITSGTDTLLVQGVTSEAIKICGVQYNFSGSAAQSVYLENTASTNANCSSTKTQIDSLVTGNSSSPTNPGWLNPYWTGLANTSGNGLCINSSGSGGVDVSLWYTQGS